MAGSITLKSKLYSIITNFPDVFHNMLPEDIKYVGEKGGAQKILYELFDDRMYRYSIIYFSLLCFILIDIRIDYAK